MALVDRIFRDDTERDRKISNHAWSAALWFLAKGRVTKQNVIDAFELTTEDQVQFDQLIAHYQALPADEKATFHSDLEAAGILAEGGFINKTQYKALLGMT